MTVAVFFADGYEEIEALTPVDYLRRAGIDVITVGVKGMPFNDSMIVTSSHNIPIVMDMSFDSYIQKYDNENAFPDCVVCPGGGMGAENLASNEKLLAHLEKVYNNGKMVAAICASPAVVLGKTSILKDKKWTCYPEMETEAAPEYLNGYENKVFITDGNLVTSRGPGSSEEFAMELVRLLVGENVAQQIRIGTQQR